MRYHFGGQNETVDPVLVRRGFFISVQSSFAVESKIETWYTYWDLGYPSISYPSELQDALDMLEDLGMDNARVNIGILGFYWPLANNRTILGGIIDGCGDRYEKMGVSLQINQYTYAFSCMHFLNDNIGKGFFLRGDIGFSKLVVQTSTGSDESSDSSDWGTGFLFGGGYGFPITPGTRITLNANYSLKRVEEEQYGKFTISIGGLF